MNLIDLIPFGCIAVFTLYAFNYLYEKAKKEA
jgi:hypothetical protein